MAHQHRAIIQNGILTYRSDGYPVLIVVGSPDWYDWLQTASIFAFHDAAGSFTARLERAGNQRGKMYWRAYRWRQGKVHRIYLGQSRNLTLEYLQTVAAALTSQGAGNNLPTGVEPLPGASRNPAAFFSVRQRPLQRARTAPGGGARPSPAELPGFLTPLIGREQELATVCALLLRPGVRLLTLVGTAGVGKTRLGLAIAEALQNDFADGVRFVSLASVSDPMRVMATIAQALKLWETSDLSSENQVLTALRHRHLLLLLDNFEQVCDAAPQLATLLASCPLLSILVTSRATLHLSGAHEFIVSPLPIPNLSHLPNPQTLVQLPSVRLLVLRIQTIQPAFQVTAANAHTIAAICVQLDGLPLALELAAARVRHLPPEALLARLSHRLEILTSGAYDMPTRQQTLRATLQWSYNLLSDEEQRLFRRLAVFVDGCTLGAAALCYAPGDLVGEVLDGVASLLDKSMLNQARLEGEEPRLLMLATVREFGQEKLTAARELEVMCQEHAMYYLHLAESATPRLFGAEQGAWLERLEREHGNLRAAFDWLLRQGALEAALRFGASLWPFWWIRGHLSEGYTTLERVLAASASPGEELRAPVLIGAGVLAYERGHVRQAQEYCAAGLTAARKLAAPRTCIIGLRVLGRAACVHADYATARAYAEEALTLARQSGDYWGLTAALEVLAVVARDEGNYAEARVQNKAYLAAARKARDPRSLGRALFHVGTLHWFAEELEISQTLLEQSLVCARSVGDVNTSTSALFLLGGIAGFQNKYTHSLDLLEEEHHLMRNQYASETAFRISLRLGQGMATLGLGQYAQAYSKLQACLSLLRDWNESYTIYQAICLDTLGAVAVALELSIWAARLWGATEAFCTVSGIALPAISRRFIDPWRAKARVQLGEMAFQEALAEGRAWSLEQTLETAQHLPLPDYLATPQSPPADATGNATNLPVGLTAREVEVLSLVVQGLTSVQIADLLVISPRTVTTHLTSIYNKLGVNSRVVATRFAIEHRLI